MNGKLLFPWLLCFFSGLSDGEEASCTISLSYGMETADCSSRLFTSVPDFLSPDIEILDLSRNRIRELWEDSLERYTALKYLFLRHNLLSLVEDSTFDKLQDLKVVDLTHNSLDTVPAGLLRLQKLRKLYVNNNRLSVATSRNFANAPTIETLDLLSLANCHLQELPPLDKFPNLKELNVSGNDLKKITPHQLAPICQLQLLDLRENPALFEDSTGCECQFLSSWMKQKSIYLAEVPLNCSNGGDNTTETGDQCESELQEVTPPQPVCKSVIVAEEPRTNIWLTWILPSVIVAACLYIVILVIVTKLQGRNSSKSKMKQQHVDEDNDA